MATQRRAYWQSEHMTGTDSTHANAKCQWVLLLCTA